MVMEVLGHDITEEQVNGTEREGSFPSEIDSKNNASLDALDGSVASSIMDNSPATSGDMKDGHQMTNVSMPKDAVDEWPMPKQIHTFYFVKYRSLEDPKLKAKIEQAEKDIQKKNQARLQLTEALKAKRSERSNLISKLKPLTAEDKEYRMTMGVKRKEMRPLQDALGELRNANVAARERGMGLCSSEEELDEVIRSLHYRMQHESLSLNEEKRLLKEIKQLEGTRDKVIAHAAERTKIQDSLGQKQNLQGQVKLITGDIDEVRKEQQAVRTKISVLENDLKAIDEGISSLEVELDANTEKRNQAYATLRELRAAREEMNACYFQNRALLNNAKDLAIKKDVSELRKLSDSEGEKFISQWSSNKALREDYERRILPSLDIRQLSRDGRMRNPNEKPIMHAESAHTQTESASVKLSTKGAKEDVQLPSQHDSVPMSGVQDDSFSKPSRRAKDDNSLSKPAGAELTSKAINPEDAENSYEIGKSQKQSPKISEIDAVKLKEIKREEEIVKAKLAVERKKKLAEKAAAKAALRAEKEAEKKLKEKEKRAKKKAGASPPVGPVEETEADIKVVEPEEPDVDMKSPVAEKTKEPKETARYRSRRNGRDQIPKTILKRKKSNSYWLWASLSAAAVLVLAMLAFYFYSLKK